MHFSMNDMTDESSSRIHLEEVNIQDNTTNIEQEISDIHSLSNKEQVPSLPPEYFDQAMVKCAVEAEAGDAICQICCDSTPINDRFLLAACDHQFCRDCITNYVRYKIIDGNVYPKCCYYPDRFANNITEGETGKDGKSEETSTLSPTKPVTNADPTAVGTNTNQIVSPNVGGGGHRRTRHQMCDVLITHPDILKLLEDDITSLEKYIRFKYCAENKDARECPTCATYQIGNPAVTPKITCSKCATTFCYFHANAHDFTKYPTCAEYEASIAVEMKPSLNLIESLAKPCPVCGIMIIKSGGCNHMKCQCGVAFCWLCGKQIIDDTAFPAHFQWWNPAGCANLQLNEELEPSMAVRICARVMALIQIIVFGPITLASALVFSCLCSPCLLVKLKQDRPASLRNYLQTAASTCMSAWGIFWMLLLLALPLLVAFGTAVFGLFLTISLILYPCYFVYRVSQRKYPWPGAVTRAFTRCVRPCVYRYVQYTIRRDQRRAARQAALNSKTAEIKGDIETGGVSGGDSELVSVVEEKSSMSEKDYFRDVVLSGLGTEDRQKYRSIRLRINDADKHDDDTSSMQMQGDDHSFVAVPMSVNGSSVVEDDVSSRDSVELLQKKSHDLEASEDTFVKSSCEVADVSEIAVAVTGEEAV